MAQVFQMARRARTYSRNRGAGGLQGTEKRRSLWPFTWGPRPSRRRPLLKPCRSQARLAVIMGLRGKAMATLVPSSRVVVWSAAEEEGEEGVVGGLLGDDAVVADGFGELGVGGGGGEVGSEFGFNAHVCSVLNQSS